MEAQPAASASIAHVIDRTRLDLICSGDRSVANELLAMLIASVDELFDALRHAFDSRDRLLICDHAHALRGNAGNVGASRLEQTVRTLEASFVPGEQPDWRAIEEQIAAVATSLTELRLYVTEEAATAHSDLAAATD